MFDVGEPARRPDVTEAIQWASTARLMMVCNELATGFRWAALLDSNTRLSRSPTPSCSLGEKNVVHQKYLLYIPPTITDDSNNAVCLVKHELFFVRLTVGQHVRGWATTTYSWKHMISSIHTLEAKAADFCLEGIASSLHAMTEGRNQATCRFSVAITGNVMC